MSIIIYHNEQHISSQESETIRKFYGCEHVITDIEDHEPESEIPPNTLALIKTDNEELLNSIGYKLDSVLSPRRISIATAFTEIARENLGIINRFSPNSDYCEWMLKQFLEHQHGEIFTMQDVLMFMKMNPDNDGALYAMPALTQMLDKLGCTKEHMTVFTPPDTPQIKQRFVSRDEIYT